MLEVHFSFLKTHYHHMEMIVICGSGCMPSEVCSFPQTDTIVHTLFLFLMLSVSED